MKRAQLEAIARDAAKRVAKNTGSAPQMCYGPILWALQDAQAEARYQAGEQFMRHYWRALAAAAVLALAWWAWP